MGFDGILRPSQVYGPLNPYQAAQAAESERVGQPLIKKLNRKNRTSAFDPDETPLLSQDSEDKEEGGVLSDEEAEQILIMAKMRGIMNFSLREGVRYEFHIDEDHNKIDLIRMDTGEIVLQLSPEELLRVSDKVQRYAGVLTDRTG